MPADMAANMTANMGIANIGKKRATTTEPARPAAR
jgi:hypothetical protein